MLCVERRVPYRSKAMIVLLLEDIPKKVSSSFWFGDFPEKVYDQPREIFDVDLAIHKKEVKRNGRDVVCIIRRYKVGRSKTGKEVI